MNCAIIGDCIALGLAMASPGCDVAAKMGRSAAEISHHPVAGPHAWAAISAGSNNPADPRLIRQLRDIRAKVHAKRVIWIVPRNTRAARLVRSTAYRHGDATVTFSPAKDGVHPRSYRALAKAVHAES